MPFVLCHEPLLDRPTKRRKVASEPDMAKMTPRVDEAFASRDEGKETEQDYMRDGFGRKVSSASTTDSTDILRTSDRAELIECIKRGQKPTWIPKPSLLALCEEETDQKDKRDGLKDLDLMVAAGDVVRSGRNTAPTTELSSGVLDPIERPRSALHSGDFREQAYGPITGTANHFRHSAGTPLLPNLSTSPPPWLFPHFSSFGHAVSDNKGFDVFEPSQTGRNRAPSLGSSLSSSFIARVPTSPLVHATNNPYLDSPQINNAPDVINGQVNNDRRKTMPPHQFQPMDMSPIDITPPNFSRPLRAPYLRRESSLPYHTHTSRRSVTSVTYQPYTSPQSTFSRSRRPSSTSEASLRNQTSMVGSFEESILRGRMSTPPSKPLDFVAQIGVMGKGECTPSLKCPAHVSVPFPAVFYSYTTVQGSRTAVDDAPSPYVGTIDLERHLKPVQLSTKRKRASKIDAEPAMGTNKTFNLGGTPNGKSTPEHIHDSQKTNNFPKINIRGAYRVPQQGQLQIIIKNPNKTAVKLFLVPYDLQGMEPDTKTFVRQRSFSSGPIIDNVLSDKNDKGSSFDPFENKHILRYLVHLKFCCPAKGKFYLHDNIRVVFANRVPDGKEKLRNEIQLPEPKFGTYKPPTTGKYSAANALNTSPSSPTSISSTPFFGDLDGIGDPASPSSSKGRQPTKKTAIPFHLPPTKSWQSMSLQPRDLNSANLVQSSFHFSDTPTSSQTSQSRQQTVSPVPGFLPTTSPRGSPLPWLSPIASGSNRSFSPIPVEAGDGLLSRKFKELNHSTHVAERISNISPGPIDILVSASEDGRGEAK